MQGLEKTDTPRTDAKEHYYSAEGLRSAPVVFSDFARELERELNAAKAELAALKAHDPLAEMWRELSEYQPMADRDGHGESWSRMCRERTATAAWQSFQSTPELSFEHARDGARLAREAIFFRRESARYSDRAIAAIRRAKEVRP